MTNKPSPVEQQAELEALRLRVSELEDVELYLRECREESQLSAERYRALFENAAEGLFLITPEGRLLLGNKSLARMFGFDSMQIMQDRIHDMGRELFLEPSSFAELTSLLRRNGIAESFETRCKRLNGDQFWVSVTAQAMHDEDGRPSLYHGSIQDISKRKKLESRLLQESYYDPVTGLVNRAMFLNLLEQSIARARRRKDFGFALVCVDIDRLRIVNESLGHLAGDELLGMLAKVLNECLRVEDTCARLSGDEFALLLSDVFRPADALRVVDRVYRHLASPLSLRGQDLFISLTMGIVLSSQDYGTAEDMLRDADTAMYRAKANPEQRFAVYNEAMQNEALERLRVETDLRRALERGEYRLFYQPIVDLKTGKIHAFEALLRWERPEVGMIQPFMFVPLLEETGLIVNVGDWVIQEACRQTRIWQREVPGCESLQISVNLSARQFRRPDLLDRVLMHLEATGLSPASLKLEITESAIMDDSTQAGEILRHLKSLGVELAIDDFGTGHSSLAYLHRFPVDVLKIDKSFVFGMKEDAQGYEIVRTIIVLAHMLNKSVIAEGVETAWHLSQLMQLRCESVQGYYFSKPVPPADAEVLLRRGVMEE